MNARKYLEQLEVIDTRIKQDQERLEEMKIRAASGGAIRYDKDKVQTSISESKLEADVCKYIDFESRLTDQIRHFADLKEMIVGQIQGLNNAKYMSVLFKVYVQYKTLKNTADEMSLSYSYTLELHKKALSAFEQTYKNILKPIA